MDVAEFSFDLPPELIAQEPLPERDAARLLVLEKDAAGAQALHSAVRELPRHLEPGDLLVVNDAQVIPARLRGRKRGSGGRAELLLVEPLAGPLEWLALGQSSKPLRAGSAVEVGGLVLEVLENRGEGELRLRLPAELGGDGLGPFLARHGEVPLPPYIERPPSAADQDRYQTVFARRPGAVAAPTAGLHFTPALLEALRARGIGVAPITLYVGPGTFLPVRAQRTEDHRMHGERYEVPAETARLHAEARRRGRRAVAVGTTALRTLEAAWDPGAGALREGPGATDLFITPGYRFHAVDALFTNFHLPRSTLLMLVAAFAGLPRVLAAYREAVRARYRFFSYGDAMLIA